MRLSFIVSIACAVVSSQARAQGLTFSVENLAVDGHVQSIDAADLDGDGKLDLIAAVVKGEREEAVRSLAVFWNHGGHYEAKPELVIPLDADVCAYDLADVDGAPGSELLAITADGVRAHSFAGRKLGPTLNLVSQPTLFLRAPRDELVRFRVAQPLGKNGTPALLVPGLRDLTLYQREPAGFTPRGRLEVEVNTEIERGRQGERNPRLVRVPGFGVSARFPSIEIGDLNGDGRLDVLLVEDEHARAFLQSEGGAFPSQPSWDMRFDLREKEQEDNSDRIKSQLRLLDVDGDGLADAVITTTSSAGISSATTTVYLYLGTPKGFQKKPDQVIRTEGVDFIGTQLADLTGDGHPDLLLPSFKLGIFAIVRMLTTNTLKVNFLLYPFGPGRKFAGAPSGERPLSFKLDLAGHSDLQAVDMYGDYLGDKRLDLAFGTDEDELSVYGPGEKGAVFADEPLAKIKVRAFGEASSYDLDGKGRSDLVLTYSGTRGHESEIAVAHNQGR